MPDSPEKFIGVSGWNVLESSALPWQHAVWLFNWPDAIWQEWGSLAKTRCRLIQFLGRGRNFNQAKRIRIFAFSLCLVALIFQFFLPLVHSLQLSSEHELTPIGDCFTHCLPHARPAISSWMPARDGEDIHHFRHAPCHCIVCQAISLLSSFTIPHHEAMPCRPFALPEALPASLHEKLISRCCSDWIARAPPSSV